MEIYKPTGNIIIDSIATRSSVRLYEPDKEISQATLETLLRVAMSAPSGVNRQPWAFDVITDKNLLKELADALPYAKMAKNASAAIIVAGDSERFLTGTDSTLWIQDLSAASENLLLAAHALGLGGVWTCIYPHEERIKPVREILNIPERFIPFNLIPLGYPAGMSHYINKWDPAKIYYNKM